MKLPIFAAVYCAQIKPQVKYPRWHHYHIHQSACAACPANSGIVKGYQQCYHDGELSEARIFKGVECPHVASGIVEHEINCRGGCEHDRFDEDEVEECAFVPDPEPDMEAVGR